MHAWISKVGLASVMLLGFACGGKGTDTLDAGASGTGASGASGSGQSGASGSGTGGSSGDGASGSSGAGGLMVAADTFFTFDDASNTQVADPGVTMGNGVWRAQYVSQLPGQMIPWDVSDGTLQWVDMGGDTAAPSTGTGAMQLEANYTSASLYYGIGISLAPPVDMTGRTITVRVKLVSGLDTDPTNLLTAPGGAKIYAKSGTGYVYANGDLVSVSMVGSWMTVRFNLTVKPYPYEDLANPAGPFDPADVREFGIQFDTGGTAISPTAATFLIDNVSY